MYVYVCMYNIYARACVCVCVYINSFKFTSMLAVSQHSILNSLDS